MAIDYDDIVLAVSRSLGYSSDPAKRTVDQVADIDVAVQGGYRQFLYPPVEVGDLAGYQWSFVRDATPGNLTGTPLGSPYTDEVVLASCLAWVEVVNHDERGPAWDRFMVLLQSAISRDSNNEVGNYGTGNLGYTDICNDIGAYLGYGSDSGKWTDSQQNSVKSIVEAGYQQLIAPPYVDGIPEGFTWSFADSEDIAGASSGIGGLSDKLAVLCRISCLAAAELRKTEKQGVFWADYKAYLLLAVQEDLKLNQYQVGSSGHSLDDYKLAIACYMGYSGNDGSWTITQSVDITAIAEAGYQQFVSPPQIDNMPAGFTWSFLTPGASLGTSSSPVAHVGYEDILRLSCLSEAEKVKHNQHGTMWEAFKVRLLAAVLRDQKQNIAKAGGSTNDYAGLCASVGAYLGYGGVSSKWSTQQLAEIQAVVEAGYRQYILPPMLQGMPAGFRWSFFDTSKHIGLASSASIDLDTFEVYRASCLAEAELVKNGEYSSQYKIFNDKLVAAAIRDRREKVVKVGGANATYGELCKAVGAYLGYGADDDKWTVSQEDSIDSIVQAGVRQFYYPPKVEGLRTVHNWSFLSPVSVLVLSAGTATYPLPGNYSVITGDLVFREEEHKAPVMIINEGQVRSMATDGKQACPQYAGIRVMASDGSSRQTSEISFYPIPDKTYTLTYKYEVYTGSISDSNPYVLGGDTYIELIIASCLAIAERRVDQKKAAQWEGFAELLLAAVQRDRRQGSQIYGDMGGSRYATAPRRNVTGDIYYNGELLS